MTDPLGRRNPCPLTEAELDERDRREALVAVIRALSRLSVVERGRVLALAAAFYETTGLCTQATWGWLQKKGETE